eukprot:1129097-Amorphochlora_amoeboformis.AAC.1
MREEKRAKDRRGESEVSGERKGGKIMGWGRVGEKLSLLSSIHGDAFLPVPNLSACAQSNV